MTQWLILERLKDNDLPKPRYATTMSAGLDMAACLTRPCKRLIGNEKIEFIPGDHLIIKPNEIIMIPLGFKCGFSQTVCMQLYMRSSAGLRGLNLANGTGIIDPDYRGELFAAIRNYSDTDIKINHGERIIQAILTPFYQANTTDRGEGGFGSTGTINMETAPDLRKI
jgi:dUTP pyrophosphatase